MADTAVVDTTSTKGSMAKVEDMGNIIEVEDMAPSPRVAETVITARKRRRAEKENIIEENGSIVKNNGVHILPLKMEKLGTLLGALLLFLVQMKSKHDSTHLYIFRVDERRERERRESMKQEDLILT